jgi:hypothetical protein
MAAWVLARALALLLMKAVLEARAAQPMRGLAAEACGQRLQSQGWAPRQGTGRVGTLRWKRRLGRCPKGGRIDQVAPLDRALGLQAYSRTRAVLEGMACGLAVLVPF